MLRTTQMGSTDRVGRIGAFFMRASSGMPGLITRSSVQTVCSSGSAVSHQCTNSVLCGLICCSDLSSTCNFAAPSRRVRLDDCVLPSVLVASVSNGQVGWASSTVSSIWWPVRPSWLSCICGRSEGSRSRNASGQASLKRGVERLEWGGKRCERREARGAR